MAVTTGAVPFAGFIPSYWDSVLGENLYANLYLYQLGAKRKVPRNFGTTIKIPRLKRQQNVAYVGSGSYGTVIPAAQQFALCSEVVSGTLKKYVGVYANSDIVIMTALSDVVELAVRDIARDLAYKMDLAIRDTLSGHGKLLTAGGAVAGSALTANVLRTKEIAKAAVMLDASNNPRPPDGYYPLVTHPLAVYDLLASTSVGTIGMAMGWSEVQKYATDSTVEKIYRGEVGRLFGARIVTSSAVKRVTGGAGQGMSTGNSGYRSMMFAPEAYYVTEIDEMTARTIVKPLGSGGTYDPDNSLATVAAKVFFTAVKGFQTTTPAYGPAEYRMVRIVHGSNVT